MRMLLFLLLTFTELIYILEILDPDSTVFDTFVLILMMFVSMFIRFLLYTIGYAPRWNLRQDLRPTKVQAESILLRERHLEPPRKSRRKV